MSYKDKPVATWDTKELTDWINTLKPRVREQKDTILKTAKNGKKIIEMSDKDWAKVIPNKLLCKLFKRELNKIIEENKNKKPGIFEQTNINMLLHTSSLINILYQIKFKQF